MQTKDEAKAVEDFPLGFPNEEIIPERYQEGEEKPEEYLKVKTEEAVKSATEKVREKLKVIIFPSTIFPSKLLKFHTLCRCREILNRLLSKRMSVNILCLTTRLLKSRRNQLLESSK